MKCSSPWFSEVVCFQYRIEGHGTWRFDLELILRGFTVAVGQRARTGLLCAGCCLPQLQKHRHFHALHPLINFLIWHIHARIPLPLPCFIFPKECTLFEFFWGGRASLPLRFWDSGRSILVGAVRCVRLTSPMFTVKGIKLACFSFHPPSGPFAGSWVFHSI